MKLRETLNDTADRFCAFVWETDAANIYVTKVDLDPSVIGLDPICERHTFDSISEYETWRDSQDWIDREKICRESAFEKVPKTV